MFLRRLASGPSRPLFIATVAVGALLVGVLATQPSKGQIQQFQNRTCVPMENLCPTCFSGPWPPNFGCAAGIPAAQWQAGACTRPVQGVNCTQWSNYDCGMEIDCNTGYPTEFNCINNASWCRNN